MSLSPGGTYEDYYPTVAHRVDDWRAAIAAAPRISLTREWTRDLPARRLQRDPFAPPPKLLEPVGYRFAHNRYTRRYAFPSMYLSDGVSTASAEVFGVSAVSKGPLGTPAESRLQLVVKAQLPDVVDLTDVAILVLLGVAVADITVPNDPLDVDAIGRPRAYEFPQCLGEVANELGVGAFRYPSVPAKGGANVVIFTEQLAATAGWYEWADPVTGVVDRWP